VTSPCVYRTKAGCTPELFYRINVPLTKRTFIPTDKSLSDGLAENETAVSEVRVAFSEGLIDSQQVQVDSIQVSFDTQVDSIVQVKLRQLVHL